MAAHSQRCITCVLLRGRRIDAAEPYSGRGGGLSRRRVLNPPEQPTLPPEEQELLKTIEQIAAQLTSVPNAQAFVISQLSRRAAQQGLSVVGVETAEPPGEASPIGQPQLSGKRACCASA
jgi:hypothetical protein